MVVDKDGYQIHIPIRLEKADRFVSRFLGLMFRKELPENQALWLVPCNSIHMFFMKFSIDVIFLDQMNRIVKLAKHVQPWSVLSPVRSAYSVLELPAGTIERYGIEPGDKLVLL
ncbi:DUF192 domain-containing protein [Effusibacillus lacus]|nr:DUF192 domain-containing protein [Effusibacillus lacus]